MNACAIKNDPPTEAFIKEYIGEAAYALLLQFEASLSTRYDIRRELKFSFGSHYGWDINTATK